MQESNEPIHVVLLDHNTLIRTGLRLILDKQPGIKVLGEADTLQKSLELIADTSPDILLLNLDDDCGLGVDAIPALLGKRKQSRIILVTNHTHPSVLTKAVQNGALGIIFFHENPDTLVKAIKKVYAGEAWIDRVTTAELITRLSSGLPHQDFDPGKNLVYQLSGSEKKIIQLLSIGLKNRQIADKLSISEITVRHHLTSIYSKLGVSNRLELLIFAQKYDLVGKPDGI